MQKGKNKKSFIFLKMSLEKVARCNEKSLEKVAFTKNDAFGVQP